MSKKSMNNLIATFQKNFFTLVLDKGSSLAVRLKGTTESNKRETLKSTDLMDLIKLPVLC